MKPENYLDQASRLINSVLIELSQRKSPDDEHWHVAMMLVATALAYESCRASAAAIAAGSGGRLSEEDSRKAYAIRWLAFAQPRRDLHETFGALRELLADESLGQEERGRLLDNWLSLSWKSLHCRDTRERELIRYRAREAGLAIPKEESE